MLLICNCLESKYVELLDESLSSPVAALVADVTKRECDPFHAIDSRTF